MHDYLLVTFGIVLFYALGLVYSKIALAFVAKASMKTYTDLYDTDTFDDHVASALDLDSPN